MRRLARLVEAFLALVVVLLLGYVFVLAFLAISLALTILLILAMGFVLVARASELVKLIKKVRAISSVF